MYLTKLVGQYGAKRWSFIASHFNQNEGRVGKQCRERWQNHLDPDVSHQAWTLEEERQLMAAHRDLGNRWVEIAKRIDGRTDSGCKNHFHKSSVQHRWKTKGIDGGLADPSPVVAKSLDTAPQSPASDESEDEEASAYALLAMLQQTPES